MKRAAMLKDVTGHINAGGRGTRLSSVLPELNHPELGIAKAGLVIGSEQQTLVEHHVERHLKWGFATIVAAVGNHSRIRDFVQARYVARPNVTAILNPNQSGTGGDLLTALRQNPSFYRDTIVISNVDTLLDIDVLELLEAHKSYGTGLTIALTQKRGVPNQDAFIVDGSGRVIFSAEASHNPISLYEASCQSVWRGSSTGLIVVAKEFLGDFNWSEKEGSLSLYGQVIAEALAQSALSAYNNGERLFLDIGTPKTWNQIQDHPELTLQSTI